ncbi:MAG: single-stranded DNA-binding protein [Fibrobacter sp.]|nr:single-stranded DNA-binding protein [Fibrobacter sp.]MBR6854891.1 single-stranded DNA-binding protein [Fibrobacter sp.]
MSTNVCVFIGRLAKNPEITTLPNGNERTRFSIAVDRDYKNEDGSRTTDWHNVVIWGSANYIRKTHLGQGDKVCVMGRMENNEWIDNDGLQHREKVLNCRKIELVQKRRSDKDAAAEDTESAMQQGTLQGDDDVPF